LLLRLIKKEHEFVFRAKENAASEAKVVLGEADGQDAVWT
jgi:hypothetical protein